MIICGGLVPVANSLIRDSLYPFSLVTKTKEKGNCVYLQRFGYRHE